MKAAPIALVESRGEAGNPALPITLNPFKQSAFPVFEPLLFSLECK